MLKELKQAHSFDTEKRKALTVAEQELFLDFLRRNHQYIIGVLFLRLWLVQGFV